MIKDAPRFWVHLFLPLLLALSPCSILCASDSQSSLRGTVVDTYGNPVSQAVICSQWRFSSVKSSFVPLAPSATTDQEGHFTLPSIPSMHGRVVFLVYDRTQTHGALVDEPEEDVSKAHNIKLQELHSVRFTLKVKVRRNGQIAIGRFWTQTGAVVGAILETEGTALLPPGKYELRAATDDTNAVSLSFTLADKNLTLKTLVLDPSPMKLHYGHGTPPVSELQDMSHHPFLIESWRGHWTLLYFWADWCSLCVQQGIPELIAFSHMYSEHSDQFRIIAIHESQPDEGRSWEVFQSQTTRFEKEIWKTTPPFPLVFDESTHMTSAWGIRQFPTYALIDPDGNLVQDGSLSKLKGMLHK